MYAFRNDEDAAPGVRNHVTWTFGSGEREIDELSCREGDREQEGTTRLGHQLTIGMLCVRRRGSLEHKGCGRGFAHVHPRRSTL